MEITTEKANFCPLNIKIETQKEWDILYALATCGMDETLKHAAERNGIKPKDVDNFLGDLYHGLE